MPNTREILTKIGSVKKTQKITRAMEMVAASKMRKAQERMQKARPYADRIRRVINHVAGSHPEYRHPFIEQRAVKRAGYITICSDRGLCGGLNGNLLKLVVQHTKTQIDKGVELDFCAIGVKAENFFRRYGGNVVAHTSHLGDAPTITDLIGLVKVMLDAYGQSRLDVLYIASNQFVNTMVQNPTIQQLLPIVSDETEITPARWDYIYEPDNARDLLISLLKRYIESQVYRNVVENNACFQAAQMVAMKSATSNAGKIIDELQLAYNKARQAAITRELAEIVAGAAVV